MNRNIRRCLYASDQVVRHARGKSFAANHDMHMAREAREKYGSLSRRIAAADNDEFFVAAKRRFHIRRAVVHASALEMFETCELRLAITRACCDHHCAAIHMLVVTQADVKRLTLVAFNTERLDRHADFSTEFAALRKAASGKRLTGDAGGKPKVVFDLRAGAGLAARRFRVENRDAQSLRRGIDG